MKTQLWVILIAAMALPLQAANFSGKWLIGNASGRGGGRGGQILTLNQVGNEVTGSLAQRMDQGSSSPVGQEIWDGKVEGDTLTFYVWVGGDEPAKQTYKGTLSGDEITFTVTGGRGGGMGFGGGQPAAGGARGGAPPGQPGAAAPAAAGAGQNAGAGRGGNASGPQQVTAKRTK
jgi:hypothetical protein